MSIGPGAPMADNTKCRLLAESPATIEEGHCSVMLRIEHVADMTGGR